MPFNTAGLDVVANAATTSISYLALYDSSTTELIGGSPVYARKPVTWVDTGNGVMSNGNAISFNIPAGTTIQYIGGYSTLTGGDALFSHACTYASSTNQARYDIAIGQISITAASW